MSHNMISDIGTSLKAGASWNPKVFNGPAMGIVAAAVGKTHSFRNSTSDASYSLPTGWSWATGPNTAIASQYQSGWRDRITVPVGDWLVEIKIGQDYSATYTGQVALFDSSNNRLSNVVSFRDANRSPVILARITGPISVEVKCIATPINAVANSYSYSVASFAFVKME